MGERENPPISGSYLDKISMLWYAIIQRTLVTVTDLLAQKGLLKLKIIRYVL